MGERGRGRARLDGATVAGINADLTQAQSLAENLACSYQGPVKVGAFDIPGALARQWLPLPNPNGRPNAEVLRPWANGQELTGRPSDTWIIDFGADMSEADAAMFEAPFAHVFEHVKPARMAQRDKGRKARWWLHGRAVADMRRHEQTFALPRHAPCRQASFLCLAARGRVA